MLSLYVLKLLRHHGMNDDSLRDVYKAVVLSKRLYASPAWWLFTCAADRQRLEASIRRAVQSGLYAADEPSSQLVADMDDILFDNIRYNSHYVRHELLPDKTDHVYNLRPRLLLSRLIAAILLTDCLVKTSSLSSHFHFMVPSRFVNCFIKDRIIIIITINLFVYYCS